MEDNGIALGEGYRLVAVGEISRRRIPGKIATGMAQRLITGFTRCIGSHGYPRQRKAYHATSEYRRPHCCGKAYHGRHTGKQSRTERNRKMQLHNERKFTFETESSLRFRNP